MTTAPVEWVTREDTLYHRRIRRWQHLCTVDEAPQGGGTDTGIYFDGSSWRVSYDYESTISGLHYCPFCGLAFPDVEEYEVEKIPLTPAEIARNEEFNRRVAAGEIRVSFTGNVGDI